MTMSNKSLTMISLGVVAFSMFITNPSEEKYSHHPAKEVFNNSYEIII